MSNSQTQTTFALSPADLESLLRRVVREELGRLLRTSVRSILEDLKHDGPDDPAEDDLLLVEALEILRQYENDPDAWKSWKDFEAELDEAEASGELPH